jgi:hypothetical protein
MSSSRCLVLSLLAVAGVARAQGEPVPVPEAPSPDITARRTWERPVIDGVLDDWTWERSALFDGFVQSFPELGAAPTEETEVWLLYDREYLYLAFYCADQKPELVSTRMGRRDALGEADYVAVSIDSAHDHRTAYEFRISAAGVKADFLHYEDNQVTSEWDETWEGAVTLTEDGWTAELAIPLRVLPYSDAPTQEWGIRFGRYIARKRESVDSVAIPANSKAIVSLYGHLEGVRNLRSLQRTDFVPFVAARTLRRPQRSAPNVTAPRLQLYSADLGLDFKLGLSRALTLTGTVNPDFGQVEADAVLINVTNLETFFPEKRPFFTQGMSIFQSVGADADEPSPQTIFYSRRIGLDAPLLGALKLSGNPTERVEIGILDAVVLGPSEPTLVETSPDYDLRWRPEQPLHVGSGSLLPKQGPVPQNYFVAVARSRVTDRWSLGQALTVATPLTPPCSPQDAALPRDQRPASCRAVGGNGAAFEWVGKSEGGDWGVSGQAAVSQVVGGMDRTLLDGTLLRPGTFGHGAYFTAGKVGGEPFRFNVKGEYASPTLDLNAVGFQRRQNHQEYTLELIHVRSKLDAFRNVRARLIGATKWATDVPTYQRANRIGFKGDVLLPGFHSARLAVAYEDFKYDLREIRLLGIPFDRPDTIELDAGVTTDARNALRLGVAGKLVRLLPSAVAPPKTASRVDGTLTLLPTGSLQTELGLSLEDTPSPVRFTASDASSLFFAEQWVRSFSITLRQLIAVTPDFTIQLYTQLFNGKGLYGPFYVGPRAGRQPFELSRLVPTPTRSAPDFRIARWNLNAVARWEYAAGSTLSFVYARSQNAIPPVGIEEWSPTSFEPLTRARTEDLVLLKWAHLIGS